MLLSSSSSSLQVKRGKLNKHSILFVFVVFVFVLESVWAAGLPCTTNSQCRRNTCILNFCAPRSLSGGSCDENPDCFNATEICIKTKCLPVSQIGGPCDDYSDCTGGTDYCASTTSKCAIYPPSTKWEGNKASPFPFPYAAGAVYGTKLFSFGGEDGGSVSNKVNIYDGTTNTWSSGTPLPGGGRRYHSATTVGNLIYIIGGQGEDSSFDTVLVYDPFNDAWPDTSFYGVVPGGPVLLHATAVVGADIIVIGGTDEFLSATDSILSFSTSTNTFTDVSSLFPSFVLPTPMASARALAFGSKVFVTGGADSSTTYDTVILLTMGATPTVNILPVTLNTARQAHGLFATNAGSLKIVGGQASDGSPVATVEVLDLSTPGGEFISTLQELMPNPRMEFVFGVLNGVFYVVGGYDSFGPVQITDAFQTSALTWIPFEASPNPISDGAARVVGDFIVTTAGKNQDYTTNSQTQKYDPASDDWLPGPFAPITNPVYNAVSAGIAGDLFVIGGTEDGSNAVTYNQKYNSEGDSWSQVSPMTNARQAACAAVYLSSVFLFGGYDALGAYTDTTQVYHSGNDTWEQINSPIPKGNIVFCSAATVGDFIYVIGGFSDVDGVLDTIQAFNARTRKWDTTTVFPKLTVARSGISSAVLSDFVYIISGTLDGVGSLEIVELFDPISNTLTIQDPIPTPRFGHFANTFGNSIIVTGGFNNFNIAPVEILSIDT